MNNESNYCRNFDQEAKSKSRVAPYETITKFTLSKEKVKINQERKNADERSWKHQSANTELGECVLNKLWDSLPPEIQILSLSQSDNQNSEVDKTLSGLDEESYNENENFEDSNSDFFSAESSAFTSQQNESDNEANHYSIPSSVVQLNLHEKGDTPTLEDNESNINFIQAIIWLKSAVTKSQRIPADEFCKVFGNQWNFSKKISTNKSKKFELIGSGSPGSSSFGQPLNSDNRTPFQQQIFNNNINFYKTNQREQVELLKTRLASLENFQLTQRDIVIDETDESDMASQSSRSSQCLQREPASERIISETVESNWTVDSGFNSESQTLNMPRTIEDVEMSNIKKTSSKRMEKTENWPPFVVNRNYASIGIEGSSKRNHDQLQRQNKLRANSNKHGIAMDHEPENTTKRRKLATLKTIAMKRPSLSISSASLNYVLRSLECNQFLFKSVKTILKVLESEESGSGIKNWHSSMQKEAVETIVGVVDQFEKEKGSDSCRREIINTIERILEKMLYSDDLVKLTSWEHHRLIILELCNAASVCTEIVDYLMANLKKFIPAAKKGMENHARTSLYLLDKSYILFHSLEIVLKKYTSFPSSSAIAENENVSQNISKITDLWRRNRREREEESNIFAPKINSVQKVEDQKEIWIRILEEMIVASTKNWPCAAVLAWQCLNVLKSPADDTLRGG